MPDSTDTTDTADVAADAPVADAPAAAADAPAPVAPPEPPAPKKSRAELELERLQQAMAEVQARVEAEAKLAETYGPGAKELAYLLHEAFCDLCCNGHAGGCAVNIARMSENTNWADEYHQYWLKAAGKVADFMASKGWQKP